MSSRIPLRRTASLIGDRVLVAGLVIGDHSERRDFGTGAGRGRDAHELGLLAQRRDAFEDGKSPFIFMLFAMGIQFTEGIWTSTYEMIYYSLFVVYNTSRLLIRSVVWNSNSGYPDSVSPDLTV